MGSSMWWCSRDRPQVSVGSCRAEHEGAITWRQDRIGISQRWTCLGRQSLTSMHGLKLPDDAPAADPLILVASNPVLISTSKKRGEAMNQYSHLARQWWMDHAPQRLSQVEDQEWFFEDLGQTIAVEVETISAQLESRMPKDLDYMDQVRRLNSIRRTAEEVVLTELLYPILDPPSASERLEELSGLLPSLDMVKASQRRMMDRLEEDNRLNGHDEDTMMDAESQADYDLLSRLAKLLPKLEVMIEDGATPEEEEALVEQLEPFLRYQQQ